MSEDRSQSECVDGHGSMRACGKANGQRAAGRMTANDKARLRVAIADMGDEIGNIVFELPDMVDVATRGARSLMAADIEDVDVGGAS